MKLASLAGLAVFCSAVMTAQGASAAGGWLALSGLPGAEVQSLAFSPVAPRFGLMGAPGGAVYRTANGGQSWTRIQVGLPQTYIANVMFAAASATVAYAFANSYTGTGQQVLVTKDGGATWAPTASSPAMSSEGELVVSDDGQTLIYNVGSASLQRSTNGGATWTEVPYIHSVSGIAYLSRNRIWAAGEKAGTACKNGGQLFSPDLGANWRCSVPTGIPSNDRADGAAVDPKTGRLFVSCLSYSGASFTGAILYSDDGGASFSAPQSLPSGFLPVKTPGWIWFDPSTQGHVVLASKAGAGAAALYESTDDGNNWTASGVALPNEDIANVLSIRPGTSELPATLFAGGHDIYSGKLGAGALTVSDTGVNAGTVTGLTEDGIRPAGLFAATHGGVYHSTDLGGRWTAIAGWAGSHAITEMVRQRVGISPALFVLDGDAQVRSTTNAGAAWTNVTPPVAAGEQVTGVFVDPIRPGRVYASTSGTDFFSSTNSGASWSNSTLPKSLVPLGSSPWAMPVAVAAAPPGTIFAMPTQSGINTSSLLKSTDYGATWETTTLTTGGAFYTGDSMATQLAKPFELFVDDNSCVECGGGVYSSPPNQTKLSLDRGLTAGDVNYILSFPGLSWIAQIGPQYGWTEKCYISEDNGIKSTDVCASLPPIYYSLSAWPGQRMLFISDFAGSNHALPYSSFGSAASAGK